MYAFLYMIMRITQVMCEAQQSAVCIDGLMDPRLLVGLSHH